MDTVHDMGGMHGFGPVVITDASAHSADWELRVLGVRVAASAAGVSLGSIRPVLESLPPTTYLASTYYERWAHALDRAIRKSGTLTDQEITDRAAAIAPGQSSGEGDPEYRERVAAILGGATNPAAEVPARFQPGDHVTVRRMAPPGHTRCPRYARGVTGAIEKVTGGFRRPDPGDHPVEQTYTVKFERRDLWGNDAEPGPLYLDLWEGYLE